MKARALLAFVPAVCVLAVAGAGWWNLRTRGVEARRELAAMAGPKKHIKISALSGDKPGSPEEMASLQKKLESLEGETRARETTLAEVRASIEEVLAKTPVAPDELTSSFGKIDDMGRETGSLVRLMVASASGAASNQRKLHELTEEEMVKVQSTFFKFLAWAPLIGEMESNPSDFAQFQAAAFREFYQLEETSTGQLESTIAGHLERIVADGWTISDRPLEEGEAADAWKAGRSAALTALMADLRPLLPERDPAIERGVLPSLLNAGVGFQTKTFEGADGNSATTMAFPDWPKPPWIEE